MKDIFYTPGPWTVEPYPDTEGCYRLWEARKEQVEWVSEGYGKMETEEEEAEGERRNAIAVAHDAGNARLMQASSKMFAQLKRTLADLEDFLKEEGEFEWTPEAGRSICREIEKAIAGIEPV